MRYLRTVSTRRLLALTASVAIAVVGGTAIAIAAAGNGPVPKREPLAEAIHQGLGAPSVTGLTARISFTNNLIDASDFQGQTDPILQGGSGRLWLSDTPGDHRLRIELQSNNGDAQIVFNNGSFSIYDPTSNTAYEGTLPHDAATATRARAHASKAGAIPSVAEIQTDLNKLTKHVQLSRAIPSDVAGQAAYTVRVAPQHDGGLLGDAQLAWDALRGIPLRVAVYARGDGSPVLQLQATDISYGPVPASDFAVSPPSGTKIVKVSTAKLSAAARSSRRRLHGLRARSRRARTLSGVSAVASHVPFTLVTPKALVGLPRRTVSLLDWAGHPAALITYGQNLGGIAVIEQAAESAQGAQAPRSRGGGGLSLPTVSINGATGQELDTALGTMVRFTRGSVAYTVIGSVPPAAADLAARGL